MDVKNYNGAWDLDSQSLKLLKASAHGGLLRKNYENRCANQ